jgi:hypothetical protein
MICPLWAVSGSRQSGGAVVTMSVMTTSQKRVGHSALKTPLALPMEPCCGEPASIALLKHTQVRRKNPGSKVEESTKIFGGGCCAQDKRLHSCGSQRSGRPAEHRNGVSDELRRRDS